MLADWAQDCRSVDGVERVAHVFSYHGSVGVGFKGLRPKACGAHHTPHTPLGAHSDMVWFDQGFCGLPINSTTNFCVRLRGPSATATAHSGSPKCHQRRPAQPGLHMGIGSEFYHFVQKTCELVPCGVAGGLLRVKRPHSRRSRSLCERELLRTFKTMSVSTTGAGTFTSVVRASVMPGL